MKNKLISSLIIALLLTGFHTHEAQAGFLSKTLRSVKRTLKKAEEVIRDVRDGNLRAAGQDIITLTARVSGIALVVDEAKKLKVLGKEFQHLVTQAQNLIQDRRTRVATTTTALQTINVQVDKYIREIDELENKISGLDDRDLIIRGISIALIRQIDAAYQIEQLSRFLKGDIFDHREIIEVNAQYFHQGIGVLPPALAACISELPIQDWERTFADRPSTGTISKEVSLESVEDCLLGSTQQVPMMDRSLLQTRYNQIQSDSYQKIVYQNYENAIKTAFNVPLALKTDLGGIRQGFYAIKKDVSALEGDANNLNLQIDRYESEINKL